MRRLALGIALILVVFGFDSHAQNRRFRFHGALSTPPVEGEFCPDEDSTPTSLGGWPMAGANPQRTSNATADITASTMGINWYRPVEAYIMGSTQLITDSGRIYVATARGLVVLDAEDGDLVCRFDTELPVSTPTVSGGYVYVPGWDRLLYKLNATTCAEVWTSTVASAGYSGNPIVDQTLVFATNRDGNLYAINVLDGSLAWSYPTDAPIMQSASCSNNILYVASQDMYGYAISADNGALVWKTPNKLPGDDYSVWWPVVMGNYLVWPASSAYKYNANPGELNADALGVDYQAYYGTPAGILTAGTTATEDGSHGWTAGAAILNTTASAGTNTLQGWADSYPDRRVYAIVNKSNGAEAFNLPIIKGGHTRHGQMHPPVSTGSSLYVMGAFQRASTNIARVRPTEWKPSTTWVRQMGPGAGFATDEPTILSRSGGRLYVNMCCDREAYRIEPSQTTFWSYPGTIDAIVPSRTSPTDWFATATDAYDPTWATYSSIDNLERLQMYYRGTIPADGARNGVYNSHGMQNPLVPAAFLNASSTRIERLCTHRSNTIVCLGATASETARPLIPINTTPEHPASTLTENQLSARLESEIQYMVDLFEVSGTAGFLNPMYYDDGRAFNSTPVMPETSVYMSRPSDTLYTLSIAYPHLSTGLKADLLTYLAAYWTKYFGGTPVRVIGWSTGTGREYMDYPAEVETRFSQIGDTTTGTMPQRVFEAAYAYAQLPGVSVSSVYSAVRPLLVYPPSGTDLVRAPSIHNDYIAGYHGFLSLYDLLGTNPDATLRANVASALSTLEADRLDDFAKDHPWQGDADNPSGININNYVRQFNCARNFLYTTAALGEQMAVASTRSAILQAIDETEALCPHWFMARQHDSFQESATYHPLDTSAVFAAKAYVKHESQPALSKWIDVPYAKGDLFYLQNLVAALNAPTISTSHITSADSATQLAKFEITFDLSGGTYTNPFMYYDATPPAGIPSAYGVTVNAQFSPDDFSTIYTTPAFLYQDFDYSVVSGRDRLLPQPGTTWHARFAPPTAGTWKYRLTAEDASGSSTSPTYTITVAASGSTGYIRASTTDTRYFEDSTGDLFFPIGYNNQDQWDNPIANATARFADMGANGANWSRLWMAPGTIQGSSWNPWYGLRGDYGGYIPRTGLNINTGLGITDAHAVTLRLAYSHQSQANDNFNDAGRFIGGFLNAPAVEPNTTYAIIATYEAFNIGGPRVGACSPNYGFVIKVQNPADANWHTSGSTAAYNCGTGNTTGQALSSYAGTSSGIQTLVGTWASGSNQFLPPLYLTIANVCSTNVAVACSGTRPTATPSVYISAMEMYKTIDGVPTGPNLFDRGNMMHHLYYNQKFAYALDLEVEEAAANGVYLQLVLQEKDEDIGLAITAAGTFTSSTSANNGYALPNTAKRYFDESWWRYVQGRWGYSTYIFSYELVNEGDPAATRHFEQANTMAGQMHAYTANRHMASTSTWFSIPNTAFWEHASYPNPDYVDVHAYPGFTTQASEVNLAGSVDTQASAGCSDATCFGQRMISDSAMSHVEHARQYAAKTLGKPLLRAETGQNVVDGVEHTRLIQDTRGVMLHNFTWAQLDHGGMMDMQFWATNLTIRQGPDGSTANGLHEIFAPFSAFLADIPLNNGEYGDLSPTISQPTLVRVHGQKDVTGATRRAHFWAANRKHTWCAVTDGTGGSVANCQSTWDDSALAGTITIGGFAGSTSYSLKRTTFDENGMPTTLADTTITSDASGAIVVDLAPLDDTVVDVAVKIGY